jgi:hypothetical protein
MIMQGNNKDKIVINGKKKLHLYLTLQLLAPKLLRYSGRLRLPNYVELISKYDPQRGSIDHTAPHRLDPNHPIQTIPSSQKTIPNRL